MAPSHRERSVGKVWRVAVLDERGDVTTFVERALEPAAARVRRIRDLDALLPTAAQAGEAADILLVSMCLPETLGLESVRRTCERFPDLPVVVLSGCTMTDLAARLVFPRAEKVLSFPMSPGALRDQVAQVLEGASNGACTGSDFGLVGRCDSMRRLRQEIVEAADSDSTVLIEGETGTGKELVARAIHGRSARSQGPFMAIDCVALAESLLESELFGHARGAFTGAHADHPGLFEAASGGTVLLDEVEDAPVSVQVRLLRVLQERTVRRVGEAHARPVDVRVIAAAQRPLAEAVDAGRVRPDLFYRLNVFRMALPPLRDRDGDVLILAEHRLRDLGDWRPLSPLARLALGRHSWPGNVRELFAAVESASVRATGEVIGLEHLPDAVRGTWVSRVLSRSNGRVHGDTRAAALTALLEETEGNRTRAAAILGVSRTTLWRMMKRLRE